MQEDIAGIGQRQGRHGKYATFYVERKMSEDFRDTPLVRTTVSRNASGVLHYIFASGKNIVASVNARPCKKQPGNSVTGRNKGSPICLPKEKSLFRWPCNEPRMKQRFQPTLAWWKATRTGKIPIFAGKKPLHH